MWARTWGGEDFLDRGQSVCVDSTNKVYITGYYDGDCDLDPGQRTDERIGSGGYLCKYNSAGDYIWGLTWPAWLFDLTVDCPRGIYATGEFRVPVDFNPGPGEDIHTPYNDSWDMYVLKLIP